MSDRPTPSVSDRVCHAKAEVKAIPKNGYNPHGKYKHATVDDVYNALRPILAKHNLDLKLDIVEDELIERTSTDARGEARTVTWVRVKALIGFDGENPQGRPFAIPVTGPQTFETINSYLQKQYLRARLEIETGEYDEQDMTEDSPPAPTHITEKQVNTLNAAIVEVGADRAAYLKYLGVYDLKDLPAKDFAKAMAALEAKGAEAARVKNEAGA